MSVVDEQFHRAVDIVQSLPKGGPVQTSYEEKLWLYSLYKQATEGDLQVARPGMLDMLGRAKWDSWNKQKGIDKDRAKGMYVAALLKILRRFSDRASTEGYISELESFDQTGIGRSTSPASSSSSYHSSQASPPPPKLQKGYPIPDPSLPAPDVAENIVPPSALSSSHRSLLNMSQSAPETMRDAIPQLHPYLIGRSAEVGGIPGVQIPQQSLPNSRAGSTTGWIDTGSRNSVHSFRRGTRPSAPGIPNTSSLGLVPEQRRTGSRSHTPEPPIMRDYVNSRIVAGNLYTPDITSASPYLGIHHPTPTYPSRSGIYGMDTGGPGPGSASTYSALPPQQPNLPQTIQQIHLSLTALHERLSSLERTQAIILRQNRKRGSWGFWSSQEEKEIEELDDEVGRYGVAVDFGVGVQRRKGMRLRLWWGLVRGLRRAILDLGMGVFVVSVIAILLGGGLRRGRTRLRDLLSRIKVFANNFRIK